MHLITRPLPLLALRLSGQIATASALFRRCVFIFQPFNHTGPTPTPSDPSHYSPPDSVCILPTRPGGQAARLSTLRNPCDFHFQRKQLLLNIFIRRLIILWRSSFRDRAREYLRPRHGGVPGYTRGISFSD